MKLRSSSILMKPIPGKIWARVSKFGRVLAYKALLQSKKLGKSSDRIANYFDERRAEKFYLNIF